MTSAATLVDGRRHGITGEARSQFGNPAKYFPSCRKLNACSTFLLAHPPQTLVRVSPAVQEHFTLLSSVLLVVLLVLLGICKVRWFCSCLAMSIAWRGFGYHHAWVRWEAPVFVNAELEHGARRQACASCNRIQLHIFCPFAMFSVCPIVLTPAMPLPLPYACPSTARVAHQARVHQEGPQEDRRVPHLHQEDCRPGARVLQSRLLVLVHWQHPDCLPMLAMCFCVGLEGFSMPRL